MRAIIFFSFLFFFSFKSNAQLRFAVKGGYNSASATYKNQKNMVKHSIAAFQVGVLGELNIKKVLLKSNILLNQKGNYSDNSSVIIDDEQQVTYKVNYLEANILAGYKFKIGRHIRLSVAAGPYASFGLWGTEKGDGYSFFSGPYKIDKKIEFSNTTKASYNNNIFKPIEFGLDINASINFKKYFLYFNFGQGLTDRFSSNSPDWNSRNNVVSVGLGFYFK